MDFAAEKSRIIAREEYGVNPTRDWNSYHEEWAVANPWKSTASKIVGRVILLAIMAAQGSSWVSWVL